MSALLTFPETFRVPNALQRRIHITRVAEVDEAGGKGDALLRNLCVCEVLEEDGLRLGNHGKLRGAHEQSDERGRGKAGQVVLFVEDALPHLLSLGHEFGTGLGDACLILHHLEQGINSRRWIEFNLVNVLIPLDLNLSCHGRHLVVVVFAYSSVRVQ